MASCLFQFGIYRSRNVRRTLNKTIGWHLQNQFVYHLVDELESSKYKLFRTLRGGAESVRNNLIVNWHTNPKQKLCCHWPHFTLTDKNSLRFIKVICQKKNNKNNNKQKRKRKWKAKRPVRGCANRQTAPNTIGNDLEIMPSFVHFNFLFTVKQQVKLGNGYFAHAKLRSSKKQVSYYTKKNE